MMKMSLAERMASASGVVGPLAPSARMRHLIWAALSLWMTRSSAAGTRIVQGREGASGRLAPADAAAQLDRLPGDDLGAGVADLHAVGVHDPGHRLFVGAQVGRHDVHARTDEGEDLLGEAAGEALELAAADGV